jgi:hypothetical protein
MSKKIDQLIIAARKASETYDRARVAANDARCASMEAESAVRFAERDMDLANRELLDAVRAS